MNKIPIWIGGVSSIKPRWAILKLLLQRESLRMVLLKMDKVELLFGLLGLLSDIYKYRPKDIDRLKQQANILPLHI